MIMSSDYLMSTENLSIKIMNLLYFWGDFVVVSGWKYILQAIVSVSAELLSRINHGKITENDKLENWLFGEGFI